MSSPKNPLNNQVFFIAHLLKHTRYSFEGDNYIVIYDRTYLVFLVISTQNISQVGNLPQIGVKIKNI